jgi:hypothetical protein
VTTTLSQRAYALVISASTICKMLVVGTAQIAATAVSVQRATHAAKTTRK